MLTFCHSLRGVSGNEHCTAQTPINPKSLKRLHNSAPASTQTHTHSQPNSRIVPPWPSNRLVLLRFISLFLSYLMFSFPFFVLPCCFHPNGFHRVWSQTLFFFFAPLSPSIPPLFPLILGVCGGCGEELVRQETTGPLQQEYSPPLPPHLASLSSFSCTLSPPP